MVKILRDTAYTGGVADPEASDIDRRAQDVVKFGIIKKVDYKRQPPSYRVAIGDENDEDNYILTDWLPAAGGRAKGDRETHYLEEGEKVVVLAEGGELASAIVLPAGIYTPENEDERETTDKAGVWRKVFKDKGEISYDREKHLWTVDGTKDGEMVLKAGGCEIHLKDGAITIKAKSVVIDAEKDVKTVGATYLGLDNASEAPKPRVGTESGIAKQTFAKPE